MKKKVQINPKSMAGNIEYVRNIYNICLLELKQMSYESKSSPQKHPKEWVGLESLLSLKQYQTQSEMSERCDLIFHSTHKGRDGFEGCTVIYFDEPYQTWQSMSMEIGNAIVGIKFLAAPCKKSDIPNPFIVGPNHFQLPCGKKINAEVFVGFVPRELPEAYLLATGDDGKKHYFELESFYMLSDYMFDRDKVEPVTSRMFTLFDKYKRLVVVDDISLSPPPSSWYIPLPIVPCTLERGNVPSIKDGDDVTDTKEPSSPSDDVQPSVTGDDTLAAEEE